MGRDAAAGVAFTFGNVVDDACSQVDFDGVTVGYTVRVGALDGQNAEVDRVAVEDAGEEFGDDGRDAQVFEVER